MLDSAILRAPCDRLADARGQPFSPPASCDSYAWSYETHFGDEPWTAEGISRATWYRRSRPIPEPALSSPDAMRWYVARAMHGQGEQADWEIRHAGFDVVTARKFEPAVPERRSPAGRLLPAKAQHFPLLFVRYVIVRFQYPGPALARIVALDSVERVISGRHLANSGVGIPISIPDISIDRLRRKLHSDGCLYPPGHMYARQEDDQPLGLEAGDTVTLLDGPFADHAAIYDASDGQRVMMLMSCFNRDNVRGSAKQSNVKAIS